MLFNSALTTRTISSGLSFILSTWTDNPDSGTRMISLR